VRRVYLSHSLAEAGGGMADGGAAAANGDVDRLGSENGELRVWLEDALREAERLKVENEELRRRAEDAELDRCARHRQAGRQTDRQAVRRGCRDRQVRQSQTDRQTDSATGRLGRHKLDGNKLETDRQTDRHTDRQKGSAST
jgi:regulator of replication initiation timing